VSHQHPRAIGDVRHDNNIRAALEAPTVPSVLEAARTLRRVAAVKEATGELRPLYLRVAELLEYEAAATQRVSSSRVSQ
jgi:hypothetical protein